jgi:hypothetical protein
MLQKKVLQVAAEEVLFQTFPEEAKKLLDPPA